MTTPVLRSAETLRNLAGELINSALQQSERKKGTWAYVWFNPPYENKTEIYRGTAVWTSNHGSCYFDIQGTRGDMPYKVVELEPWEQAALVIETITSLESMGEILYRTNPTLIEILREGDQIGRTIPQASEIHGVFFIPTQELDITITL